MSATAAVRRTERNKNQRKFFLLADRHLTFYFSFDIISMVTESHSVDRVEVYLRTHKKCWSPIFIRPIIGRFFYSPLGSEAAFFPSPLGKVSAQLTDEVVVIKLCKTSSTTPWSPVSLRLGHISALASLTQFTTEMPLRYPVGKGFLQGETYPPLFLGSFREGAGAAGD